MTPVRYYSMQARGTVETSDAMNVRRILTGLRAPTATQVAAIAVAIIAAAAALVEFWHWIGTA